ncbi:MAG: acyltransferase [Lachnospiraceae bacterium]|nr:acyltransferase [Lachnospiraceae bacterium]
MKRQANFEILRIVAMVMIVTMHFMQRGGILQPLSTDITVTNCIAWLIESFCIVAANCYVLVAGYFLVDTQWKGKKLVALVGQVLFYSLLIPVVCLPFANLGVQSWTVYDWIVAVLPIQMEHYWFATAYVLMFLLSPVLAAGVKQLSKKQMEVTIGLLLIYFSVFKSISPILLSTDRYGYDYPWFICLFLIAAYIKMYGTKAGGLQLGRVRLFDSGKKSIACYIGMAVFIFLFSFVLGRINAGIGKFDYYMNMVYSYNHILTLFASLSLFFAVKHWQPKEGKVTNFLCRIAPYTFGVYLIHENIVIRNAWPHWFGVEKMQENIAFVPYMIVVIVCVFTVCMLIDYVRKTVFKKLLKL